MAKITSRAEFKAKVLRRLGDGAIQVNVTDDQVEDCIDDALLLYQDYHYDGTSLEYYKWELTQEDIDNKYITMPEGITGATRIFSVGGFSHSSSSDILFNVEYHLVADLLYNLNSVAPSGLTNYQMTMQNLSLIKELIVGRQPIRYNRKMNKLYIDMDWGKMRPGRFLMVEVFRIIDPEVYTEVWNDRWLQNYTRALVMEQWGTNLIKFPNVQLPGGVSVNAEGILQRALEMKDKFEAELKENYANPPLDMLA